MRIAFAVALTVMFFSSALYAGTVTLTGSCKNTLQAGNTILGGLSNTGNDTAYNMVLVPRTVDAVPENSSFNIASMGPGSSYNLSVALENITAKGSFVDSILLSYQQGSLFVTDIFPCYLVMGNLSASSDIYISAISSFKNGVAAISVRAYNAGRIPLAANISIMLPPSFKFLTNTSFTAELAPYSSSNFTFAAQPETSASSVGGAVASSYILDGIHYSSIALITVRSQTSSSSGAFIYAFSAGVAVVIAAIVALIFRAAHRNRKHSMH